MPDRFRVIVLPRASSDLQGIYAFIEQHSPQNAANMTKTLIDAIDSLEEFPFRYPVRTPARAPARVVRSMPVPPYLIYYRVDETRLAVRVLTVRHGSQPQPKRFP